MNKRNFFLLWGLLLLEFLYIFTFLLNYDLSWMNPEKIGVHAWILSNGSHWQTGDWTKFLNTQAIELSADRLSRPLSNFVEVVDTKWRAWAWNFITPHPSLSLQWPFMFILLPWLLYRTLVNMGCFPLAALTGVCIYLASPGFLGPLVMLFHPAKNLANFFGILGLYCFSLNYKKLPSLPQNGGRGVVIAGYSALFLGFLSDETGLYVYLAALLLFHRLWIRLWQEKHYGLLSGWLILPVLYLISIQIILPYLHWIVLGSHVHLNGYESYPSIKSLFWPDWSMLWLNSRFLFADHPHWLINYKQLAEYPLLWTIQAVYVLTFLYLIFLFFKSLSRSDVQQKAFLKLLAIGIVLMAGYCFFQTFQLSRNAKAWGVWWYGSLFSLIYIFPLVFFLQFLFLRHQKLCSRAALIALIFVANGLIFTTYRLGICKLQNLNRSAYSYIDIFKGIQNPYGSFSFSESLEISRCRWMYTHLYWRKWKGLPEDIDQAAVNKCYSGPFGGDYYFLISERNYLPAELR